MGWRVFNCWWGSVEQLPPPTPESDTEALCQPPPPPESGPDFPDSHRFVSPIQWVAGLNTKKRHFICGNYHLEALLKISSAQLVGSRTPLLVGMSH